MLQIIGYIFLIGIAILILKFGFMIVIRCCAIGIVAFFGVGMICLILYILGFIEGMDSQQMGFLYRNRNQYHRSALSPVRSLITGMEFCY